MNTKVYTKNRKAAKIWASGLSAYYKYYAFYAVDDRSNGRTMWCVEYGDKSIIIPERKVVRKPVKQHDDNGDDQWISRYESLPTIR